MNDLFKIDISFPVPGFSCCAAAVTQFFIIFLYSWSPCGRHCLLFQLKGKVSALSRGKSGIISILINPLDFYLDTRDTLYQN